MTGKLGALTIIKQANKRNTGTVIFFHGSGDTGEGLLEWVKFLVGDITSSHLKFLFPTAPLRPYTPLNGEKSHVWFDRYDITPEVPEHKETLLAIDVEVKELIDKELQDGIPLNRIIVGGFSMGGALALHTAYRTTPGLAGVFTLSSFLNKDSLVYSALKNRSQPLVSPLLMYHGDRDNMVPVTWGETTFKKLKEFGVAGDFHVVKNAYHELKKKELLGLLKWINEMLPED